MNNESEKSDNWKNSNIHNFWGNLAEKDHLVQIYESEAILLNTLEGFAGTGLLKGESIITIATSGHQEILDERLKKQGFDLNALTASNQYITLNANQLLSQILVDKWPDEEVFNDFFTRTLFKARNNNKKVRVFREMASVLWQQGLSAATVRLENLWQQFHQLNLFSLYCAYPLQDYMLNPEYFKSIIFLSYTKEIDGKARPSTEIYYKPVN